MALINNKTHLDEIVNYPNKVINELYKNQNFVSLLVNKPNADLTDEVVEEAYQQLTHNYDYVDGIIQTSQSFMCVDTEIVASTNTIKDIYINILIGVNNSIMNLSNDFKFIGNRRDNLIREIDYILRLNHPFLLPLLGYPRLI